MEIIELGTKQNLKGKAGNLNLLYHDFSIVRGIIIPNKVFQYFLKQNHISLSENHIEEKIKNGKLETKNLIEYLKKNKYQTVIVRSSVSLEDQDHYAFSGQFDSFPNTKIKEVEQRIKDCWISLFKSNIHSYLNEKRMKTTNIKFDILIQEMMISDISGIAFSINPANGKQEILIEATKEQCKKLVEGKIIPYTYHLPKDKEGDSLLTKEQLSIIKENVQKLKNILRKEIEIEFCFKNSTFYLFQIRPITSIHFSLDNYIKEGYWCDFKNNNWQVFHRSLWILGATKYKNKRIHNEVTEDIIVYYPKNQKQIRGFNGNILPLDQQTIISHTEKDIMIYIENCYKIAKEIHQLSKEVKMEIEKNEYQEVIKDIKKIIDKNAQINSYEYLVNSLTNPLQKVLSKNGRKRIEEWKNNQSISYFPIYQDIFKYISTYFKIEMDIEKLLMYTHVEELIDLCNQKLNKETLIKRINQREKNGFVLCNLQNKKYQNKIITKKETIEITKKRFQELEQKNKKEHQIKNGMKGSSTFKNDKVITGECVVIKDNTVNISKLDIEGKILVCPITTAKDVEYLKKVKAIITDYGGILCHAAIFSREFNIPCLMGCEIATEYFKTDDIITYDINQEIAYKKEI